MQPDEVNLWYFKLRLFDLTQFVVWNKLSLKIWKRNMKIGAEKKNEDKKWKIRNINNIFLIQLKAKYFSLFKKYVLQNL